MPLRHLLIPLFALALLGAVASFPAQAAGGQVIDDATARGGLVLSGVIKGDDSAEYVIRAEAGQILSVDLLSANGALVFNIARQGMAEALFIGATAGNVADLPVPETGAYVIQLSLMRASARRGEQAEYSLGVGLAGADFVDGLVGGPDWWQISGLQDGSLLNIRSGPGARYPVLHGAANGQLMQNRGCRMTGLDRWCSVRLDGTGQQGWVAGRFLIEAAAPQAPAMPAGGPTGNGVPFDATGELRCSLQADGALAACLFRVVRDGPGNAGVWIAIGGGEERAILFEAGRPVSADADLPFGFDQVDDLFIVRVGDERYEIAEALISGG